MKKFKFNKISIIVLAIIFILGLGGIIAVRAFTNPAPVALGTSGNFAVLAGAGITSTNPPQVIVGSAGSDPTVSNGLTGAEVTSGTNYTASDAAVIAAKVALSTAYGDVSTRPQSGADIPTNLGTQNLSPGVYHAASGTFGITGAQTLTLDGGGNPNAVFIFKTDTTLITGGASSVVLTNGAQACNVFWAVGSAATLDHTTFVGTIMANTEAITDTGGSTINGRLLARTAAVTLNNTHVTVPTCVPHLTLAKTVDNTGGGTELNTAWTLTANGTLGGSDLSGITGATGADSDLKFTNATFKADTYTLAETGPSGYTASLYSCVKNGGAAVLGNSITLVAGDNATCTVTNTYDPTLHLRKTVSGGTALDTAWTLTATGTGSSPTNLSGTTPVDSGAIFKAGTYTLAETGGPDGYNASLYSCRKNGGTAVLSNSITLVAGDNATCTITNTFIPPGSPTLHLRKTVVGTALDTAWTITATGPITLTGTTPVDGSVLSDTYTLSESVGPINYNASTYSCVKNGGGTVISNSIILANGDDATCTITNTYTDPNATLNVIKVVVNDSNTGTKGIYDFPLFVNGSHVTSGVATSGLVAGTYTVTETYNPSNYTQSFSASCPGGIITLGSGDNKTCTITNDDIAAAPIVSYVGGGGIVYGCKDPTATNYNAFVSSKPELCKYTTVVAGESIVPPLIHVTKVPSPLSLLIGWGLVTYTETITNPGTVPLSNVTISDDKCSPVNYVSGDLNNDKKLDSTESWIYTCQVTLKGTTTNTASVSGEANGFIAKDSAVATVVAYVPGLPKAGYPPRGENRLEDIILLVSIILISSTLSFVLKKHNIKKFY